MAGSVHAPDPLHITHLTSENLFLEVYYPHYESEVVFTNDTKLVRLGKGVIM